MREWDYHDYSTLGPFSKFDFWSLVPKRNFVGYFCNITIHPVRADEPLTLHFEKPYLIGLWSNFFLILPFLISLTRGWFVLYPGYPGNQMLSSKKICLSWFPAIKYVKKLLTLFFYEWHCKESSCVLKDNIDSGEITCSPIAEKL